jgi:hypothetical protein
VLWDDHTKLRDGLKTKERQCWGNSRETQMFDGHTTFVTARKAEILYPFTHENYGARHE